MEKDEEDRVLRYFRTNFNLWALGLLDQETERMLNELPASEDWKHVTAREWGMAPRRSVICTICYRKQWGCPGKTPPCSS